MFRRLLLFGSNQRWVRRLITRYRVTRAFAWRFVAGESAESALKAVRELQSQGVQSTLDLLGESVTDLRAAEASVESYLELLEDIRRSGLPSHISLKLTQLGLDVDEELCRQNLQRILSRAEEYGVFVRFDMESSAYTQRTLDMYRSLRPEFSNFGVVIQSYLYRSAQDIEDLIAEGARVRLCKGAYLEPADVAYQRKEDVDANYILLMERLLSDGNYPAIATHDPAMIAHARRYVREHDIPNSAWEFQMLYGVRRDLQESLAAEGYNMRCYVPFGTEWYPYFMRRLAERPANLAFLLRNVLRERRNLPAQPGTGTA
ncbi:MAG: proline dehydrogenase family protein [Chloroflexota bacterium]|nr:proline dehydrogenase family protein [Chloroflexota bacterium]